MGASYLVVAPDRGEYLDPVALLRSDRLAGVLGPPVTTAVLLLVTRARATAPHPLAGAWHGTRVDLVADTEDDGRYPAARTGFTDVSRPALALVAAAVPGVRVQWATAAATDEDVLACVAPLAVGEGVRPDAALDAALDAYAGRDWRARYRRVAGQGRR